MARANRANKPRVFPANPSTNGHGSRIKWEDRDWRDVRDEAGPVMRIVTTGEDGSREDRSAKPVMKPEDVKPKSAGQAECMETLKRSRVCFIEAVAGSGKTHLAIWNAVRLLQSNAVDGITFFRPAIEMGSKLGYLPGSKEEKIAAYMTPMLDELHKFYSPIEVKRMIREGVIQLEALQFLRGQNIERRVAILDEAQNCTYKELQAFLTRLCEGSFFTILGDVSRNDKDHPDGDVLKQSDLPAGVQGALEYYSRKFVSIDGVNRVEMTAVDVARDPIVRAMLLLGL